MSVVRFLARPLLASSFILAGADKLKNADETAEQLSPVLRRAADALPVRVEEKTLARAVGATQLGAGLLFALGKAPRFSASVLALTSALNTFVEWRTADIGSKELRSARRARLLKNVSLVGGVLLASVDTAGRPSLAWRAQHLAADASKTARSVKLDAAKTAKSVKLDAVKTAKSLKEDAAKAAKSASRQLSPGGHA
ncbi:MAG: DoxX family protein [Sinomonas sp.]|nr:DoxX family protein [Sinomonas sp.]